MHITDAELEIMRIIWEREGGVTSKEIAEKLPGKKITTVLTLAGRLIDKGMVKSVKVGRTHAHIYSACISEEAYRREQTQEFVSTVHHGSAKSLLSALFSGNQLTSSEVDELRKFLKDQEEQNE